MQLEGDSHVFAFQSDTRTLTVEGTVHPRQGDDMEFVLLISGNGAGSTTTPSALGEDLDSFTVEAVDALSNPIMLRVPTPKQRCHAVPFRIRENILSGDGSAGVRFVDVVELRSSALG